MAAKSSSLGRFMLWRTALVAPVVAVIGLLTFALARMAPGDPARLMLGEGASEDQVAHLNEQLGLDRSLPVQLWRWVASLVQGDFGESIRFDDPVSQVVLHHIWPTLSISVIALLIMTLIGIPLGLIAGHRRGSRLDRGLMMLTFIGMSLPEFWVGMMLVLVFAVGLEVLPVSGYVGPGVSVSLWFSAIILPGIAMAIDQIALISRMVRDSVISTTAEPWVTSLHARGLRPRSILGKHQLKSASVAAITVIGNAFAGFITAAVVVEIVFNIHGFGWLIVQAAQERDYPLLQGAVIFAAVSYVLVNLLVDMCYAVLDPRIRARGA